MPIPSGRGWARAKTIVPAVAGTIVVVAILYHIGISKVAALLLGLGWRAPLILVPYGIIALVDVQGWSRVLPRQARQWASFWSLYGIRLAGEAVNNLTPTAGLAGEPLKAYLLRQRGVDAGDGVASVMMSKAALVISQILFTLAGIVLALDRLGVLRDHAALLVSGAVFSAGVVALVVVGLRRGMVEAFVRRLRTIGLRSASVQRLESLARDVDGTLIQFCRDDSLGFLVSTSYHALGWLLGVGEVMLFFALMGIECGWRDAFIIESLTQASTMSEAIVPGALGVQELSGAVLCRILGIGEASGLALMLLKRVRQLAFSLLGLALISHFARRPLAAATPAATARIRSLPPRPPTETRAAFP